MEELDVCTKGSAVGMTCAAVPQSRGQLWAGFPVSYQQQSAWCVSCSYGCGCARVLQQHGVAPLCL
jgi:hypothetical protein